jgi:hypothetical protein
MARLIDRALEHDDHFEISERLRLDAGASASIA